MPKAIRINAAGQVVSQDNPVKVSKKDKDDVLWIAINGGGPWTITFDKAVNNEPSTYPIEAGNPFSGNGVFVVTAGGSNGSVGGPTNGLVGRTYRYNVRKGTSGNPGSLPITHDPDVDVET